MKSFIKQAATPRANRRSTCMAGPVGDARRMISAISTPINLTSSCTTSAGAGKSKPYAEIRENTTENLVEDIEKLRKHLQLDRVILFGGSWGSTLALAYAEKYPQNVSGIVLRGVFTATRSEIDHYYHGGTAKFFPEVYQELAASLDHPEKKDFPAQLLAKLTSTDPAIRDRYARAWLRYEGKIAFLVKVGEKVEAFLREYNPYAIALIENYYMANGCFLEEGQLLKNAGHIGRHPGGHCQRPL